MPRRRAPRRRHRQRPPWRRAAALRAVRARASRERGPCPTRGGRSSVHAVGGACARGKHDVGVVQRRVGLQKGRGGVEPGVRRSVRIEYTRMQLAGVPAWRCWYPEPAAQRVTEKVIPIIRGIWTLVARPTRREGDPCASRSETARAESDRKSDTYYNMIRKVNLDTGSDERCAPGLVLLRV